MDGLKSDAEFASAPNDLYLRSDQSNFIDQVKGLKDKQYFILGQKEVGKPFLCQMINATVVLKITVALILMQFEGRMMLQSY